MLKAEYKKLLKEKDDSEIKHVSNIENL